MQDRVYAPEAAQMLGRAQGTLAKWRVKGIGPSHYSDGYRAFYLRHELDAYMDDQLANQK